MLAGKVWKFGDNINTDLMLPGPCLYSSAEEQAKAVFISNRPEFLREMRQGDVIIGGFNYGMGSSRPAARSLRNCGVGFLLAEAINGLFFRNAVNFGFRAFECPGVSTAFEEGDTAELSIEDWTATNTRTGQTLAVHAGAGDAAGDDAGRRGVADAGGEGADRAQGSGVKQGRSVGSQGEPTEATR